MSQLDSKGVVGTTHLLKGLTILPPVDSPNTDGIDPGDSCLRKNLTQAMWDSILDQSFSLVRIYPNCYSRVISVNGNEHIIIFAKRDIKQWEELTYDYRFTSSPNEAEGAITVIIIRSVWKASLNILLIRRTLLLYARNLLMSLIDASSVISHLIGTKLLI
ncbi:Histone-lysine N-methyltransferase ATX2 [Glycine max]|nr:Histone-lysine N-methyltransferase ATX2 [Glycine max]